MLNEGAQGAPEQYEMFKAPEGWEYTPDRMGEVTTTFKDMGLSQEQGQKLMDLYAKEVIESSEAPYRVWRETQEEWRTKIKNDPEIGGRIDHIKSTCNEALGLIDDPKLAAEFRYAMDYTGAGNNPAFIKTFYKLSQLVTEGRPAGGGGPSPAARPGAKPTSLAEAMYPNLPSARGSQ